ncbi:MAG TPA: carboxypeptidase-like regulatory domain-containing protein [Solirubrobacterales bacterium]|jgi:hypothetical protein|nr:carboxypeptidase-like regulatory domain-containing protein [Solirubrobacterales bacterium]
MRRRGALLIAIAALALVGPGAAVSASARPPAPVGLEVAGGEEAWHPVNRFYLSWRLPDTGLSLPIVGTDYLIRNHSGTVIAEQHFGGPVVRTDFKVPGPPGEYTAEVWLDDLLGAGAHAAVTLRYDDTSPPSAAARQPGRWLGRADFPFPIQIEHPEGALPVSGIRGYAISVDGSPEGRPCEGPSRCTETETDLRGGIGDDSIPIAELPQGESHVHVVAVSGSGMSSAEVGDTVIRVDRLDPVTRLSGIPDHWTNHSFTATASAADADSGMAGGGAFTAIRVDGGLPTVADGDSVSATVIGDGVHRIARYAQDAAGNVNDGATRNGVPNLAPAVTTVGIDREPPRVAFLVARDPADPELIRARVTDALAGPSTARGSIAVRAAGSGDRFQPLPTQVLADGLRARWDSEAYLPGRFEFRATGYDAAGNAGTADPMILPNPLKTPTTLSIGFGGETLVWQNCTRKGSGRHCRREAVSELERRPQSRVVPYGRGTLVSGLLRSASGTPVPSTPVRILETLGHGPGARTRIATVGTDSGGRFSIRLPAGPSREISASFAGTRTLTRAATPSLRLGVRSRIRLHVSAAKAKIGGRPIVFSGRVVGGPGEMPADGKALSLQFRLPGIPWTEFRTLRTDRMGRFRYAYRFSDDDSRGARFQFRAFASAQNDWPYEPGSSGPVAVLGV